LLRACLANPQARIGELDYLGAEERATILQRWAAQATPQNAPEPCCAVYVLDEDLQAVGIGVYGELYLSEGKVGSAHEDAGLTARRYLPNAYGDAGSRLYRTGDIVRWLKDGRLEHIGRGDRRSLPPPQLLLPNPNPRSIGAREPDAAVIQKITEIWQDRLGLIDPDIDRNFFELGGTSFVIQQVHVDVMSTFSVDLKLSELFQYPTIRSLAARVTTADKKTASSKGIARAEERKRARREAGGARE